MEVGAALGATRAGTIHIRTGCIWASGDTSQHCCTEVCSSDGAHGRHSGWRRVADGGSTGAAAAPGDEDDDGGG